MSLARATGFARERGTLEKPKLRASVCACLWAWVWVGAGVALGDTLSLSIFLSLSLSLSLGVYVVVWAWVQLWRQRQHGTVVASVACESVSACMVMKYQYNDRGRSAVVFYNTSLTLTLRPKQMCGSLAHSLESLLHCRGGPWE
jgi:hypothetical protein